MFQIKQDNSKAIINPNPVHPLILQILIQTTPCNYHVAQSRNRQPFRVLLYLYFTHDYPGKARRPNEH